MQILRPFSAFVVLLVLLACSGKPAVKPAAEFNAEASFARANRLIDDKEYVEARTVLLEVRNRDLTRKYAPLAQLRIADSYAKEDEPELAIAEYRKFLELYPDHRHAAYAQYQVAMVYFGQIEDPERGYGGAAQALAEFQKLKKDYPRNPYKDLVELRIEKCKTVMADYEFLVGEFYMKNGSYAAAISRFEGLLTAYPDYKKQDKVLLNLGLTYKKTGDREKSAASFRQILDRFPSSGLAATANKELSSLHPEKK